MNLFIKSIVGVLFFIGLSTNYALAASCTSPSNGKSYPLGTQIFDSTSNQMLYCNGSAFVSMANAAAPTVAGSHSVQVFNYSASSPTQTFTVPTGVTQIYVQAWGAGGNGGKGTISNDGSQTNGGGGGGGGYGADYFTVTPGQSISITVGNAGGSTIVGTLMTVGGGASGGNGYAGAGGAGGKGGAGAGSMSSDGTAGSSAGNGGGAASGGSGGGIGVSGGVPGGGGGGGPGEYSRGGGLGTPGSLGGAGRVVITY